MKPIARKCPAIDTKLAPELVERFRADLTALIPGELAGKHFGLAVSGGPDSVAMLLIASSALPGQIIAASVDHGLRRESAGECASVGDLCARLAVPHETLEIVVAEGNLQEQARNARYKALAKWAEVHALDAVLTAHHADDQAETLLMRLNRGSGLAGLAGVRASSTIPGTDIELLRPLLGWRKAELENIVTSAGIETVLDPSNIDDRFDRSRMRKALGEADWLDIEAIGASAAILADAEEVLVWAVEKEWAECVRASGDGSAYAPGAPFALQLRIVARMVEQIAEAPRQGALARLMRELKGGEQANIAGALLKRTASGWEVTKEPARRG